MFDALNAEFGFVVDLCADADNFKCANWLPRDLSRNWEGEGVAWLNPPFGKEIAGWTRKIIQTPRKIVACLPGRTNPPWWHDHVMRAAELRFVKRKQSFDTPSGHKGVPPWGVVIAIFDPDWKGLTPVCKSWDWRKIGEKGVRDER